MFLGVIYYVPSGWSLFLSVFHHASSFIYRLNFLAWSLAFMISLHALGLYKWLLNTSQDDSLFITRWKTSFNMVLSWGICFLLLVKYQWHRRWYAFIKHFKISSSGLFKNLKLGILMKNSSGSYHNKLNLPVSLFYLPPIILHAEMGRKSNCERPGGMSKQPTFC